MKQRLLLIYIFSLFVIYKGNSQALFHVMRGEFTGISGDSVKGGSNVSGNIYVRNVGDSAFQGTIRVWSSVNGGHVQLLFQDASTATGKALKVNDSIRLAPLPFPIKSDIGYTNGLNVVVVWPTGHTIHNDSIRNLDSFKKTLKVYGLTAIFSPGRNVERVTVFPNPGSDFLLLKSDENVKIKRMIVTDMNGRETGCNSANGLIDIRYLKCGSYILNAESSNGSLYQAVFLKE